MTNQCKTCGHDMTAHIYHEGACRPGWVCEAKCEKFVLGNATQDEATRLADEWAKSQGGYLPPEIYVARIDSFKAGRASQDARIAQLESALRKIEKADGAEVDTENQCWVHQSIARKALSTTDRDDGKEGK